MSPLRLALAILAAAAPVAARAAIFCPGNEAEFRQALASAAANGEDDEIRLRPGTFYTGGQKFAITTTEAYGLAISGGWMDDVPLWCSHQSPSAAATILDGQNLTAVLDIHAYAGNSAAGTKTVSVSNLTLRNGYTNVNGESAGLALGVTYQTLRLERTILLGHTQATAGPNIYSNGVTLVGWGDVYVLGNLMGDLHSNYANLGIFTQGGASQAVYLTNNTLSLSGAGFNALLDANTGTQYRIVNNAIVATGFGGLSFNSRNASDPIRLWIFNNLGQWSYSDVYRDPPRLIVQADSGNLTNVDPMFAGALDLSPAAGSPLVNAGLNSPFGGVPATDLDGHPRVDLGIIDVGAYESARERIFANSFD